MTSKILLIIIGLLFSNFLYAEHGNNGQTIYSKKSRLTVENLNKATEIIRDPTQIPGSFRNALNNISNPATPNQARAKIKRPQISLNALVAGSEQTYSAMLNIENQVRLVKTGHRMSVLSQDTLYEIVINNITRDDISLTIFPMNETITLR